MSRSRLVLFAAATLYSLIPTCLPAQQNLPADAGFTGAPSANAKTQPRLQFAPEYIAPLTAKEKFGYEVGQTLGVHGLLGSAFAAGVYQKTNTPKEWGDDAAGYGQRFGSFLGTSASRNIFDAALEGALHQDPRYLPNDGTLGNRLGSAAKQTFVVRGDNGAHQFAYARLASAAGAAFLANTWNPDSRNSAQDAGQRAGLILASDFVWNLTQELIPFTRAKAFRHSR